MAAKASCEYYIGLMSGTSIDSLDGVLVAISPKDKVKPGQVNLKTITTTTLSWTPQAKELLNSLCTPKSADNNVAGLALGRQLLAAQASLVISELLKKSHIQANDICAIGSHGQTIWHAPQPDSAQVARIRACLPYSAPELNLGFSLQIDNGPLLAASTGIDTVSDFRSADLAQGGQGAPLTQAFHQMIFGAEDKIRLVLNLGGIANLTVLDRGARLISAYDTGPANTLIDLYCRKVLALSYDPEGRRARQGKVNHELLAQLLSHPYFKQSAPKSTGRELFNAAYLQEKLGLTLTPAKDPDAPEHSDLLATLTEFTALTVSAQIALQVKQLPVAPIELIVCGGGACNKFLISRISECCAAQGLALTILNADDLGVDAKFIEAQAFAYFAYCTVHALPLNLGSSTGAKVPSILGSLSPAAHGHYARKLRTACSAMVKV